MSLGDRVAVMRGGVLQQVSTPRDTYALPENVFVAAFIGTPRINLLQAVVYAPLDGRMSIDLGKQRLPLPEPLSTDHQLLRIQQGRQIIVGLRSEATRIAPPSQARPGEVALTGIVEHMEYQGHEALVHFNTGSQPAVVADLESPRPQASARRRRSRSGGPSVLTRIKERAFAHVSGPVVALDDPEPGPRPVAAERPAVASSDLVVRTGPDVRLRTGAQVPLLVDLAHLYVFDHHGRRICPAPTDLPGLDA
jgi:multiple sugar transport system ATP-binding protein